MKHRYLEVTFRHGRPLAAYLYLPRREGDTSARSERRTDGLVVDFADDGRAIGIEITSPGHFSLSALNQILAELHEQAITSEELAPLAA